MPIDYRSDTVTLPARAMLHAMQNAPLGDDVFEEDPSVNKLEQFAAAIFGMEAAIFCPSGTMTNQIAIKCHTQPGDEVICDESSHIYQYEGGGIAFNSGCSVKLIHGDRGRIRAAQVLEVIQPDDVHRPVSRLVSLENTSNRGGGSCYNMGEMQAIGKICKEKGLSFHLDGARLFNAIVANSEKPETYGQLFDSISVCLSKGLGAPVGSVLIGKKDFIRKARRVRKVFGGGMRQAGMLAAAGLYALENNVDRLSEDHIKAKSIASALSAKEIVEEVLPVETNIIIFRLKAGQSAAAFVQSLKEKGILSYAIASDKVRLVVHLDISEAMVSETIKIIESI